MFQAINYDPRQDNVDQMPRVRLREVGNFNRIITLFRDPNGIFRYEWGTIKAYVVVCGHFAKFLKQSPVFDTPLDWYEDFKIDYEQTMSTCSQSQKHFEAEKAKNVS